MPNEIPYGYGANVSPYYTVTPGSVNAQGISTPSVVTDTRTWWHRLLGLGRNELAAAQNASLQEQMKYQSDMAAYDEYHNSLPYQVEQYQAAGLNPQLLSGGLGQGSSNAAASSQSPENPGVGSGLEDLQGLVSMLSPILSFVGQANEIASANARTQSQIEATKAMHSAALDQAWKLQFPFSSYQEYLNRNLGDEWQVFHGKLPLDSIVKDYRHLFSTDKNQQFDIFDVFKFLDSKEAKDKDLTLYDVLNPAYAEIMDYIASLSMSHRLASQGFEFDTKENEWRLSRQGLSHQSEALAQAAKDAQTEASLKDTTMVTDNKFLQPLRAVMSFLAPLLSLVAGATGRALSGRRASPGRQSSRSSGRSSGIDYSGYYDSDFVWHEF